ncbi:MAG: hypothetical protein KME29_00475 [Calothrix sp. FI2-JRJ7]|nr:hypothetical protein [Calothrix sp. FI2-JRJ7]
MDIDFPLALQINLMTIRTTTVVMNKFKYFPMLVLYVVLMGGATSNIPAQAGESKALLIADNQSLSQSDIDKVIAFYEWAFAVKFTPEQRNQYKSIKLNDFSSDPEGTRKDFDDIISTYTQFLAKNEEEQSQTRQAFNAEFIKELRKLPSDAEAKLLLSIYDSAHSQTASNNVDNSSKGVGDISSIVGKWVWARTGSSTYSNAGTFVGSNGSRFTYQFLPNGTVEYTGIMNIMSGGCSQQIFKSRTGKVSLSGSTMTINWSKATFTRDFSCDRANNYTKTLPAEKETYQVRFKTDLGQKQLCLTGKDETCYSPTN